MQNILKLHEAIAVVLLSKSNRSASLEIISEEINNRRLYIRKDNQPVPSYQIKQRTYLSKGRYHHLFKYSDPGIVTLR